MTTYKAQLRGQGCGWAQPLIKVVEVISQRKGEARPHSYFQLPKHKLGHGAWLADGAAAPAQYTTGYVRDGAVALASLIDEEAMFARLLCCLFCGMLIFAQLAISGSGFGAG